MHAPEPQARPAVAATKRRAVLLVVGLFAVLALAAYRNAFEAPFVLDDADSITENATLHHLWPLWRVLSPAAGGATVSGRPVFNLSLAVNYAISGDAVWSYHVLNLLIHFLAACVLFGIVRRTLGLPVLRARFGDARLPLAAAAAGAWLAHPLLTESVTYVSQRAESLAGLFCLLTLYGFIRSVESNGRIGAVSWRAASFVACLLGMATKEITAAVPLLVLAYDVTFVCDRAKSGLIEAWRLRRGYYAALASTWILLAELILGSHLRGGTVGASAGLSTLVYLQTQCYAIAVYLKLCVWPHPLVFDYGLKVVRHLADVWLQAVMILGLLIGTTIGLWRRSAAGFAGAWFFAILGPSSSFVPIGSETMAEHRMYLPLAAVVVLAVTGLYAAFGRRSLVIWPVVAGVLGWMTFVRNETYGSELALWRDTVAKAPHNGRARYNLSIIYSKQGHYAEAAAEDEATLRNDDGWTAAAQVPPIENKLGYDLASAGRLPEAVAHFEQALRLRPGYGRAHLNLARALVRLGRYPEAIRQYGEAVRLLPKDAGIEAELGGVWMHESKPEKAIEAYRTAVRLAPAWAPGFNNLAYVCLTVGKGDEAVSAYREAVRLNPRYVAAWVGLGYALIRVGRPEQAIAPCREAAKLQPKFADAQNILGIAFAETGRTTKAVTCFENALRLGAGGADVHTNLANAQAALGRTDDAIAQYREALRLDPNYVPARDALADLLRRAGLGGTAARIGGEGIR